MTTEQNQSNANAEEFFTATSSELIKVEEIEDTPFKFVINSKKNEKVITMGKFVIASGDFIDKKDCLKYLKKNMFNIMWKVALVINETTK